MWAREWKRISDRDRNIILPFLGTAPVSVGELAVALGLKILAATLATEISGEISPDATAASGFKIRVNRNENKFRQRFTVAHEIGHYLLHSELIGEGLEDSILYRSRLSNKQEAEANRMAADILMPPPLIEQKKLGLLRPPSEMDAIDWANEFGVSHIAMKIRLGIS